MSVLFAYTTGEVIDTRKSKKAKSKYESLVEPNLFLIECWARDGVIEEEIAKRLGIAYSTLRIYKGKFSALSAALKKGKEVSDYEVETSLYKKAMGYTVEVKKAFKVRNIEYENGKKVRETEEIQYATEEVHIPADTTAQIFWLKNRRPDKWRDKPLEIADDNEEKTGVVLLPDVASEGEEYE